MRHFWILAAALWCCTSHLGAQDPFKQLDSAQDPFKKPDSAQDPFKKLAPGEPATVAPAPVKAAPVTPVGETIVYPVRTGAASDLAESLRILYPNSQIIFQDLHNVLLIRTGAESKEEILAALTQLDRPQPTIAVWVYLLRSHGRPLSPDETAGFTGPRDEVLKRVETLRASDQLAIENRIELTTLENQRAMVQSGQQLPVVVGTTITSTRGRANSYQQIQTGTLLDVTARTTPDGEIVMEINFEKSQLEPQAAPSDDEADPPRWAISKLTQQATVRIPDGQAVLAGTMIGKPDAGADHAYLVVTAKVRQAAERPQAAGDPFSRPNPFSTSRPPRTTRPQTPAGSAAGSGARIPVEQFEATARSNFDRIDRDADGVLSGEELSDGGMAALRDDFKKYDRVSFEVFRQVMASRFGITLPQEARKEPQPDHGGNDRDGSSGRDLDSRYLDYARRMIARYDGDRDGKLNAEERAKGFRNPPDADADDDGLITAKELAEYFQKR